MQDHKLATDKVIARMLTEPTGTHFLDSGGESGRGWQQRAGMGLDDFRARPEARVEVYRGSDLESGDSGDGIVILDTFHYLSSRLDYCHGLTLGLHAFGRQVSRRDEPWLATMEAYVAKRVTGDPNADDKDIQAKLRELDAEYFGYSSFNSYNDENCLSSDIQGIAYTDHRYGTVVVLHTHNGADIRGGYSTPHVFVINTDEPHDLFEWNAYSVVCSEWGSETQVTVRRADMLPEVRDLAGPAWSEVHCWDKRGRDWIEYGGGFTSDPWENGDKPQWHVQDDAEYGQGHMLCPACSAPAEVYSR